MKRVSLTAVALSFSLAMLISSKALAGGLDGSAATRTNNTNSNNTCMSGSTGVHPSPYTGGAGVSRVFYPADGSTVTVTTTGAVIKQSPCGTPYREGWVNTANMSCLNTFDDLSGQMESGRTNPFVNNTTTCTNQTSTTTTVTRPSSTTTTVATTSSKPVVAAATTTATTSSKAAALPNTGPGNVLALGGFSTLAGTLGHYIYRVRRSR